MDASSQQPVTSQEFPQLDGLLVDRDRFIRLLKDALYELHTLYRLAKQRGRKEEQLQLIKYWEAVLAWIKEFGGSDVVVISRRS